MSETAPSRTSVILISDFVCPWCWVGLAEIERLEQEYDIDLHFAPFLLRPDVPPGGGPARHVLPPEAPPSPLETRGQALGIRFRRGRTLTSYSHLALQAAEFALEHGRERPFRRRVFRAYFDELLDIGDVDTLVRLGEETGLDGGDLRRALAEERYKAVVDEGIAWSRSLGVTAIPTFVLGQRYALVGAHELDAFREVMRRLGQEPRAKGTAG